jgi:hypothetical protein
MADNTNLQSLQSLVNNIEAPNMTIGEAASELKQSLQRDYNPILKAVSNRRNYRRAIILIEQQAPNFRDIQSIADCLWEHGVVSNKVIALELAQTLQLNRMSIDFTWLEFLRGKSSTSKVKEFEKQSLQKALEEHTKYKWERLRLHLTHQQ